MSKKDLVLEVKEVLSQIGFDNVTNEKAKQAIEAFELLQQKKLIKDGKLRLDDIGTIRCKRRTVNYHTKFGDKSSPTEQKEVVTLSIKPSQTFKKTVGKK